jgi:hypothetical protein
MLPGMCCALDWQTLLDADWDVVCCVEPLSGRHLHDLFMGGSDDQWPGTPCHGLQAVQDRPGCLDATSST